MGSERVQSETVNRKLPPGVDRIPSGYRVRVYGPDGKRRTIGTYPTAREATDMLAQARTDVRRGQYIDRRRGQITLDAWVELWMPDRDIRPGTLRKDSERYRLHIKPYLGSLPLVKITPYQVSRWLAKLTKDGRKPPTVKKAHTLLSTALGVHGAVGDQRIPANPCQAVRPKNPERPRWTLLTRPEIEAALAKMPARYKPHVLLAAYGGLRWSEIAGLQRPDYNPLRCTLTISRSVTYHGSGGLHYGPTKNRRTRTINLPPRLVDTLNTYLEQHPTDSWLFTLNDEPLRPYVVTNAWRKACTEAGVTARFHDLRHSCASLLLEAGATLAQVRDHLGHSSVTVTEVYLHTDRQQLATVVERAFG